MGARTHARTRMHPSGYPSSKCQHPNHLFSHSCRPAHAAVGSLLASTTGRLGCPARQDLWHPVLFFQLTAMPYARRPRPPRSILNFIPRTLHLGPSGSSWEGKPRGNVKSGSLENHTFQWCIGVMTEPLVTGARGSCWPPSSLGAGDLPCYTVHFRSLQSSSLWILSSALY